MEEESLYCLLLGTWKKKLFFIWWLIAISLWLSAEDAATFYSAIGVVIAGLSNIIFWIFRNSITNAITKIRLSTKAKFILMGSLGAAWVEFEFWVIEMVTGISGIAASPNLFLDLLVTMPWYIAMVWLLYKVETKYSYSLYTLLLFGGTYDLFADGFLGTVLNTGTLPPEFMIMLLISFPVFMTAYSFMIFPASYILKKQLPEPEKTGKFKYIYALRPLIALLIYSIILIVFFM